MEEEVRDILHNAVRDEAAARGPLGSRLAARFAGIGLDEDIPELRGQPARPACRLVIRRAAGRRGVSPGTS